MGFLCFPCFTRSNNYDSIDCSIDNNKAPEHCCSPKNAHVNTLALTAVIVLYLIFGAVAFQVLESDEEQRNRAELKALLQAFLQDHQGCLKSNDFEILLEKVSQLSAHGISPLKNVTSDLNWSFGQAFFFAGTLVSTVGYGHLSPATQAGKTFTIVYCILGIPLTLALLSALVERMKMPSTWLLNRMKHRASSSEVWPMEVAVQYLHLLILSSLILVTFFLIPSAIFRSIEPHWSFMDAFYYCFISLTTVGLGDYTPGDQPIQERRALYKILTTGYLMFGLCGTMLFLETIYDIPTLNLERFLDMETTSHMSPSEKQEETEEKEQLNSSKDHSVEDSSERRLTAN